MLFLIDLLTRCFVKAFSFFVTQELVCGCLGVTNGIYCIKLGLPQHFLFSFELMAHHSQNPHIIGYWRLRRQYPIIKKSEQNLIHIRLIKARPRAAHVVQAQAVRAVEANEQ